MKSISRFSRNTIDALQLLNKLVEKGIELRFELENMSTKDERVRLMFTVIAAMAQKESRSKSEDIKWGMKHQASQGKAILNHSRLLGYTKNDAGELIIVEDEADICYASNFEVYCIQILNRLFRNRGQV